MGAATIGAIAAVAGSVISSRSKAKGDAANTAANIEADANLSAQEARQNMQQSRFDADQSYYYNQLNRQSKQRGLDQFRQFNTIAPVSANRIVVPEKPNVDGYAEKPTINVTHAARRDSLDRILDPAGLFG